MRAVAGASVRYAIPQFHVVLPNGTDMSVFAATVERARSIIQTMYGREAVAVTPCYQAGDLSVFGSHR